MIDNFSVNVNAFDLITGYRADDSYFDYAESFLNNGISVEQLARAMRLGKLGEQIVIKSKFAFSRLKYEGFDVAEKDQYYVLRKARDDEANQIFKVLSFEELQKMYYTLHEADITKFVGIVDSKIKEYFPETNLKRIRTAYGFTQAELAERSGVSLRSIQMYEQRNKNINKASADTMYSLAKVLGCTMENLIER